MSTPNAAWVFAAIPSNAPTACSISVGMDIVRNARLGFGGDRSQVIEKAQEKRAEPQRARFAQTETDGHSEPSFGQAAGLCGSGDARKPL